MATARKDTVVREVVTKQRHDVTVLELEQDEARFLSELLAHIGGNTRTSRRKHQRAITAALADAGYPAGANASDLDGYITVAEPTVGIW